MAAAAAAAAAQVEEAAVEAAAEAVAEAMALALAPTLWIRAIEVGREPLIQALSLPLSLFRGLQSAQSAGGSRASSRLQWDCGVALLLPLALLGSLYPPGPGQWQAKSPRGRERERARDAPSSSSAAPKSCVRCKLAKTTQPLGRPSPLPLARRSSKRL